jgi:hypothetical protein
MATISGTAVNSDGSKIDGTATVSTSWNYNKAYPRSGRFTLELGSNPRQTITVYLDGMVATTVYVDGHATVHLVRR